jgi:hypothetical protein
MFPTSKHRLFCVDDLSDASDVYLIYPRMCLPFTKVLLFDAHVFFSCVCCAVSNWSTHIAEALKKMKPYINSLTQVISGCALSN